ncbi:MAG: cytochrome c [Desulfosalsimonas sp.]
MIKRLLILGVFAAAVLAVVYAVVTFYDRTMSAGRMWETPAVRPHEEPVATMDEGVVPFSGGEAQLRAAPADKMEPPWQRVDEQILESGRTAYSRYCVHCHGKSYDGNGTVGQSFSPLPTDLTSKEVQNMPSGQMFHSISYGTENGRQPPLHATMTAEDRWHVTAFVKSLDE